MWTDVDTGMQEVLRGAAAALTLADLARDALRPLCDHLQAHLGLCYRLEASGQMSGAMARGADELLDLYRAHGADDPLVEAKAAHNPQLAVTTELVPRAQLRRSHVYRTVYRRADAEHQLVARLTPLEYPHPGVTAVVLCRSARGGGFVEAERALLGRLVPALTAAARRIERTGEVVRERDLLAGLAAQAGVYAALDLDGRRRWMSPAAEAELGARPLPEPLAAKVRELRGLTARAAGPPAASTASGGAVVIALGAGERAVEAVLTRDGDGWSIVLHEARRDLSAAVARAAAHYGLLPSEARVLDALARGKSNAEAARELFRSCETVRTHVHHVLRKMRARTRLEAVARVGRFARA